MLTNHTQFPSETRRAECGNIKNDVARCQRQNDELKRAVATCHHFPEFRPPFPPPHDSTPYQIIKFIQFGRKKCYLTFTNIFVRCKHARFYITKIIISLIYYAFESSYAKPVHAAQSIKNWSEKFSAQIRPRHEAQKLIT